ncbi:hypothetical protein L3X38_002739 [Prunus dulcis]|uniref:Uncharacterized protein n=1 Tax=Prunus dulcis TaxID=3755 RepID=A0AAD4WUK3_PRUDU|nr:hypothetical protein L3X38_002739 [Prunus dulcis]
MKSVSTFSLYLNSLSNSSKFITRYQHEFALKNLPAEFTDDEPLQTPIFKETRTGFSTRPVQLPVMVNELEKRVVLLCNYRAQQVPSPSSYSSSADITSSDEAVRFLKLGLLCVQEMAKLRPPMSRAVKILSGEVDIKDSQISEPRLISDIMEIKMGQQQSCDQSTFSKSLHSQ